MYENNTKKTIGQWDDKNRSLDTAQEQYNDKFNK